MSCSVAWQDLADTWVYEGTGVPLLATPCQGLAGAEGISAMRRPEALSFALRSPFYRNERP